MILKYHLSLIRERNIFPGNNFMPIPIKHCFLLYKKKHIVKGNRTVFQMFGYLIVYKLLIY